MAGGQALDLAAVGKHLSPQDLERMHVQKTGALIRASVRLGALAAGCRDAALLDALERYGHAIGLAFQIRDDILDVEGESAVIGKTAGKDAANDKPTYPAILGMGETHAQLRHFTEQANRRRATAWRARDVADRHRALCRRARELITSPDAA